VATGLLVFCCAALSVHALLCSCVQVHLFYHDPGYWVRVRINWEEAGIEPNGASVYFFPEAGGEPHILLATGEPAAATATRYFTFRSVELDEGSNTEGAGLNTETQRHRVLIRLSKAKPLRPLSS
jgi:hypothetical protein